LSSKQIYSGERVTHKPFDPGPGWVRYQPRPRSYSEFSPVLEDQLRRVDPSGSFYHPCAVDLDDGSILECVFVQRASRVDPAVVAELSALLHRPALFDEVLNQLRTFALDASPPGRQSAAEKLLEARRALERPAAESPAPTAVLVESRESINIPLDTLLRRRPEQEAAGKTVDKIVSLGKQCGLPEFGIDHFRRIGTDLAELVNRLSGAKQNTLDIGQVSKGFDDVLEFYRALLSSLDLSKLRAV
jgi:hypothetical protein